MYIFFECAACLILVAFVGTLLFAVCALLIILKEGAAILGRLARRIARMMAASLWRDRQSSFEIAIARCGGGEEEGTRGDGQGRFHR